MKAQGPSTGSGAPVYEPTCRFRPVLLVGFLAPPSLDRLLVSALAAPPFLPDPPPEKTVNDVAAVYPRLTLKVLLHFKNGTSIMSKETHVFSAL